MVAMHREVAVGVLDRVANLQEEVKPTFRGERLSMAICRDGHAIDIFHNEVGIAVGGFAGIENSSDVGMVQLRQDLTFLLEPAQEQPADAIAPQNLDRYFLFETSVGRSKERRVGLPPRWLAL